MENFTINLKDNNTFQIVFVSCFVLAITFGFIVRYTLKQYLIKRNKDVDDNKYLLTIFIFAIAPIVLVPIWLSSTVSITFKIVITIISVAAGVAHFMALDRASKAIKKYLGIGEDGK